MPISDRDYMRGSHPPSCTCVECTNRRLRKWQNSAKPRKSIKPPRPPAMTRQGNPSGALLGCALKLLVVFILLLFGFVVWSLWGNQITSFFNGPSTSSPPSFTEPLPQSPPPVEPALTPSPVQPVPERVQPTPAPTPPVPKKPPQTIDTKVNYTNGDVEEHIYLLINMVRQQYGLNPLKKGL